MSFLRINGYTIPVTKCDEKIIEIGSRSRGLDGTPLVDRQRTKRAWECETSPLPRRMATAVRALVLGQGDVFPFDSDDYSAKGLAPESGAVRTLRGIAADGDPVEDEYKFSGAVAVEPATTNLLDADSRDAENAPTGFTALNSATISGDTSNYWQGTKSLKVVTSASPTLKEGAKTAAITTTSGNQHSGSVYLKGDSGGEEVDVYIRNTTLAANGVITSVTLTAGEWKRVECTISSGLVFTGNSLALYIVEKTSGSNITFYADGFQLEEASTVTSWVDGTRANGVLPYDSSFMRAYRYVTFNFWARIGEHNDSSTRHFIHMAETGIEVAIARSSSALFMLVDSSPNSSLCYASGAMGDDDWHMVTGVLRRDAASGVPSRELYVDGVSVADDSPTWDMDFSGFDHIAVGYDDGGSTPSPQSNVFLDDVMVLPFAADDETISSWYSMGKAMPSLPRVYIDGDVIPEDEFTILAIGTINGIQKVRAQYDGEWMNNLEVIRFAMEEV